MVLSIFVDTNCFIQLRDLQDLPWSTLFPEFRHFEVVVTPVVIEELDRMKIERDGRRRDRSRRALQLIEAASEKAHMTLKIRAEPIEISMRVTKGARPDWTALADLDSSRADDQLVAAALKEVTPGRKVLLSYDTGPLIRARIVDLDSRKPPLDWHLPEQPNEAAQEISRLKRDLEAARATRPRVEAVFVSNDDAADHLFQRIPLLAPLPVDLQRSMADELVLQHPRESLNVMPDALLMLGGFGDGYSEYDVIEYSRQYEAFEKAARGYFEQLHERIAEARRTAEVCYAVKNTGTVTATNLLVEFEGADQVFLMAERLDTPLTLPHPPARPKTRGQRQMDDFNLTSERLLRTGAQQSRDPTAFFWQDRPTADSRFASSICAEFRPARTWHDTICLLPLSGLPFAGRVRLEVSATNLAAPVSVEATLRLEEQTARWTDEDVLSSLDGWVAECLRQASPKE